MFNWVLAIKIEALYIYLSYWLLMMWEAMHKIYSFPGLHVYR